MTVGHVRENKALRVKRLDSNVSDSWGRHQGQGDINKIF